MTLHRQSLILTVTLLLIRTKYCCMRVTSTYMHSSDDNLPLKSDNILSWWPVCCMRERVLLLRTYGWVRRRWGCWLSGLEEDAPIFYWNIIWNQLIINRDILYNTNEFDTSFRFCDFFNRHQLILDLTTQHCRWVRSTHGIR